MHPDLKSNKSWACEKCGKRLPNLKVHWRLIATIAGGVPLLVSAISVIYALMLPLVGAEFAPAADWLKVGAMFGALAADWLKVAAVLVALNAFPLLILVSAYVIPRPWNDGVLKTLVLVWVVLILASLVYRAWEARSIVYFCVSGLWPSAVLVYFVWLSGKTREIAKKTGFGWSLSDLLSRAPRPATALQEADGRGSPVRGRAAIEDRIDALRGRVRRMVTLHGVGCVACVVITAVLLLGVADYLAQFEDRGIRVMSWLAVLGLLGWACYRYLYLGLTTSLSNVDLARRLQRRFPSLGDSLASAVEFLEQREEDPTAGSVALRRAVIAETTAQADQLDFRACIEPATTIRSTLSALVISLTALSLVMLDPLSSRIALARLVNPFGSDAWPQTTHLALLDRQLPEDRIVEGEAFEIKVIDIRGAKLPPKLRIRYRYQENGGTTEEIERIESVDGVMLARRSSVTRSFSYRLETPDDQSMPWIPVTVVPPPAEGSLSAVSDAPADSEVAVARLINTIKDGPRSRAIELAILRHECRAERIAAGQWFEVEVIDSAGAALPSTVRIHYRFEDPNGVTTQETELMRYVDGVMVARREDLTRPFSYRVEGGDDHSMPWIPVEVLEPPALESISVKLTPPDYTGWSSEQGKESIRALVGSRVEITARSTKPLRNAFLCLGRGPEIQAQLAGEDRRELTVGFLVETSGAYWFRLTDVEGLTGGLDTCWEIQAVTDAPPSVSIEQPTGTVFVTPGATVPLRVAAKDDLAVDRVELVFSRSDRPEQEPSVEPLYPGQVEPLHSNGVEPQAGGLSGGAQPGHNLVLAPYHWQLSELGLQPGTQVTFHATATDRRPNTGQSDPRRLVIITPEELTERIASLQAAIVSELSRVLEMQKQSRRQVGDLEIRLGEAGGLSQLDRDRLRGAELNLRGAELNQRQVRHTLTSRSDGVPMHILGLLADLENNKVDSPDIARQMQALLNEIDRLETEHFPIIERELTSAIKAAQVRLENLPADDQPPRRNADESQPPEPGPAVVDSLAAAGKEQDQVIASLGQMRDELGQWDRYRGFHSKISQLLRDQQEVVGSTKELGSRTLTKDPHDLLPQESADLKILARRQFDLARDLDSVQLAMERASTQLRESNPLFADAVSDALYRARELAISGQMRSAAGSIQENQMGQAIEREEQVIEGLREVLDILANRREDELGRLVKQLRDAESELAKMAGQQEGLRKQIDEAERLPDEAERRGELERLSREQKQLEEQADRMARRLKRLMAESAGQTVAEAAQKMQEAGQSAKQGDCQKASKQAEGAKQDLEEARRQVAQRRLEAELQLALEQMARLEETLQAMHRREEKVIEETLRLDQLAKEQGELTRAQLASLHGLARDQGLLQSETVALTEKLVGADVFNLALSGAAREMARAAALLDRRETGTPTQAAEQNALRRLDQLLEALKPEEPKDEPGDSGGAQGGQEESEQPPGSGVQALVELKLLKLLQQEVNHRTRELEETFGSADTLTDEALREYTQLSEEQGRLADLLLNLIAPQGDPEDNPASLPGQSPEARDNDLLPPLDEEGQP